MSNVVNKLYEFGNLRFDAESNTLWRGETMISLPSKALEVLRLLIESEGKLVTKKEILSRVWAETFVEDGVLTQNIYTLRQTLGTDENGKQFIENIPRRGYRFVAPVKILKTDKVASDIGNHSIFINESPANLSAESLISSSPQTATNEVNQTRFISASKPRIHSRFVVRYAVFIGLGIFLLSAFGFGIYQFIKPRNEKRDAKIAPIEQLRVQRLTDIGDVIFSAISPNGELLAYIRHEEQGESIWVKQIATGSFIQTLPPSRNGYRSLNFSPDSRYLFFRQQTDPGAIYQTSTLGGTPKKVADNVWSNFSVSPDGKQFAFIRRDLKRNASLLILSNLDGSGERELSVRTAPSAYANAFEWSPDGTKILVSTESPRLLTIDVSSGEETELKTPQWRAVSGALWMLNGKYLIISARAINESFSQLWMFEYPGGELRRLTNDLEAYFSVSLSADGQMLVARQQKIISHLWLLPEGDLKNAKQITSGVRKLDGYGGLNWTQNGKIIYSHFDDADNITDLYIINPDGSNQVQLTANAGRDNGNPTASQDGRYIIFTSNRTGNRQIWRMDTDGRNPKQLTFANDSKESADFAALSPDGTEVFFIKRGAEPSAIWKVSIEGGTPVQVSRLTNATAEGFLAISPDGKWLAYRHVSDKPEANEEERTLTIGVLPIDGKEPKLFELPIRRRGIQWSPDSKAFYYIGGTFNSSILWRQPLNEEKPEKIIDFPDRIFSFAWSSDAKNLIVSRGKQQGDALLITNLPFAEDKNSK